MPILSKCCLLIDHLYISRTVSLQICYFAPRRFDVCGSSIEGLLNFSREICADLLTEGLCRSPHIRYADLVENLWIIAERFLGCFIDDVSIFSQIFWWSYQRISVYILLQVLNRSSHSGAVNILIADLLIFWQKI